MELIPAIDIINGKCVRLHQGKYDQLSEYSDDLPATGQSWQDQGARWLHLVDLDGAKSGKPDNFDSICQVVRSLPTLNIEVGGGIRDYETVERYLDLGVQRVIIGSQAVKNPDFFAKVACDFPNKIALGLDARDGQVMTNGWLQGSQIPATKLIEKYNDLPLSAIIYTDISRDGTLSGVNIKATRDLAQSSKIPVFASGGVSGLDDIKKLFDNSDTIAGAVLGKSLYEGKLDFTQAMNYIKNNTEKT